MQKPVTMALGPLAPGYVMPLPTDKVGDNEPIATKWVAESGEITMIDSIGAVTKVQLIGAGAPPEWKAALSDLSEKSNAARVSDFWLLLSYLLATLGELCLLPVGLSMVTKLAPKRFASLFMGVWLLASSVAQYMGGSLGEQWGHMTPVSYFNLFVITSVVGGAVLLPLIYPLRKMMHEVK